MFKKIKKWIKPILAIAVAAVIAIYAGPLIGNWVASWGGAFMNSSIYAAVGITTTSTLGGVVAGAITGALAGFVSGAIMTGSMSGALKGALWGGISGAAAFGVAELAGSHSASFLNGGGATAVKKAIMHGISRAAITKAQGGRWSSGFWSGFAASGFSPGTTLGGKGTAGFTLRTVISATIGGTVSQMTGGRFANGAVTGAFQYMFNEAGKTLLQSLSELGRKLTDGTITGDFKKAAIGTANGVKEVMINAPTHAKIPLYIAGSIVVSGTATGVYTLGSYYMMSNPNTVIQGTQLVQGYLSPMTANTPIGRVAGALGGINKLRGLE